MSVSLSRLNQVSIEGAWQMEDETGRLPAFGSHIAVRPETAGLTTAEGEEYCI